MDKIINKSEEEWKNIINDIISKNNNQYDVIIDLYKIIFSDFHKIKKIDNYPQCGEKLALYISNKLIKFDRKYHPNIIPGGAWMNWGFSTNKDIDDWSININQCSIIYK